MVGEPIPRVVTLPTDEEFHAAFVIYAAAVGKVAHSWNFLHERLGGLFADVTGMDRNIALAIWYSTESDRSQDNMLKAAIAASPDDRWLPRLPNAKAELLWMIERVINLAEARNNAIHAPCSFVIDSGSHQMAASIFSGHKRAKNLLGKKLLEEFEWCERRAEALSRFADRASTALRFERYPWPERPALPTRGQKKVLPD